MDEWDCSHLQKLENTTFTRVVRKLLRQHQHFLTNICENWHNFEKT